MTDKPVRFGALVLAAGQSSRMQSTNKLLAKLGTKTLLQHVLTHLQQSVVRQIIVVTGHQHEQIQESIVQFNVGQVYNPDYRNGLSTSIKAGIESLGDHVDAVFICHGDMPFVTGAVINLMAQAMTDTTAIVQPVCLGQPGNPLLWSSYYFDKLKQLSGDRGGKQILKDFEDNILRVNVENIGILLDIDESAVLELFQERFDPF